MTHDWVRTSDDLKEGPHGEMYFAWHCRRCRITAKRFGLSSKIYRDKPYRGREFTWCEEEDDE